MPTSKVHRKLAQSFFLHTSRYNRISAEEISVGRRAFGEIYARIIQRAYRRYKKKPASLAKCAWNAIRYYDNREELRHFSSRYFQSDDKRGLYHFQLAISAVTLLLNVLFQKGYIMLNWPPWILPPWTDVFKWAQNPKYYQFATEEEWRERINDYKYNNNITKEVEWRLRFDLIRFLEYDKFYAVHGMSIGPANSYICLLWPSNRKIFRRISPQSEKAYNMWASFDKNRRGTETINDRIYPKDRNWYTMEKFMKATEKSYYTFFHKTFDLAMLKKSR